uniref:Titin n=1 Tax=Cyprinus carpio TaxID=7962 RepID=A0A8C2HI14_CYPCA
QVFKSANRWFLLFMLILITSKFQCVISGSEPMNVVWHKDNIAISLDDHCKASSDKNKYFLEILNLQQSDQGSYLCKASNSVGTATCCAELRVVDKPNFVKSFEATTIAVGNPLRLECQVDEDSGVSITWMRDGKKLHTTMDCKLAFEEKIACLEIQKAKLKDTGAYTCTAANDAGSSSYQIIKPSFTRKLKDMESIKGSFAQLECLVSGSLPITVTWFKENKEIETDEKHKCIFFENAASLEISHLDSSDSGNYTCIAKNQAGTKPESQDVIPGSRVQFNVLLSGTPPLTIKWFKDKKEVSSGIDCSVQKNDTSSSLELFFAKPSDSGDYVCEISNDVGSDALTVVKPGQLVIDTYWFRDGNEISTACLKLAKVAKSDIGEYTCKAENSIGSASSRCLLTVQDVPGPVKNLQVVDTADGEVSIAWEEPENDGGSKILAYVVERRDIKRKTWTLATDCADSTEYCVTGLQKDSKYLFRVCARNRIGSGPNVETDKAVQAKNKFDVPDPPQNVIVGNVNKFGATVSWEPPLSDGGSEITSYIIELRDRTSVSWSPVMVAKPHERSAIINDVIENKEYIFRVKAENKAGIGKPSAATNPVKIMDPIGL